MMCNRISLEDYLKLNKVPSFVNEIKNKPPQLGKPESILDRIHEIMENKGRSSCIEAYGKNGVEKVYEKCCQVQMFQKNNESGNEFYRIEFNHPKFKVTAIFIVGHDYPQR
jgi:hypothetical protein